MIIYVETNFVLEFARLQEQHDSCEGILSLAEAQKVSLIIPAFSITEARTALLRLRKQRVEFHTRQLIPHLHELSRSKPYREISSASEPLTKALIESSQRETAELESVTSRLLHCGHIIPLETVIVESAVRNEKKLGLEAPDAAVYASIIEDLRGRTRGPKCFLNKNSKDFANPDIYAELKKHGCKMIPSFDDGFRYVSTRLPKKR